MSLDQMSGHWCFILNIHSILMMPFSLDLWVCRLAVCTVVRMVNIVLCCPTHARFLLYIGKGHKVLAQEQEFEDAFYKILFFFFFFFFPGGCMVGYEKSSLQIKVNMLMKMVCGLTQIF